MMISIVVPATNEENKIQNTLKDLSKIKNSEIIVVCNGCTDNTYKVAKNTDIKNLRVYNLPKPGKGNAVLKGLKKVNGDIVGFIDSDGAFDHKSVEKLIKNLDKYDCVIGSKWKGQEFSSVNMPFMRKFSARGWNFLIKILFGMNFVDTQAGIKFMKRKVLDSLNLDFILKGFAFDVELLYKIKEKGFKIKEVYTPVKKMEKGTFSLFYIPNMFYGLFKLWFNVKFFGKK